MGWASDWPLMAVVAVAVVEGGRVLRRRMGSRVRIEIIHRVASPPTDPPAQTDQPGEDGPTG